MFANEWVLKRRLILIIVYIGLFLDYSLLTAVEPILPSFFLDANQENNGTDIESREKQIENENMRLGLLVGSKSLVQMLFQPLIGPLTTKIGFSMPLFIGLLGLIGSTTLFAFGQSYWILFLSRSIQGIGSACVATAGLGLLAEQYKDDEERSHYMGIAMSGMALGLIITKILSQSIAGLLIGPSYGGAMYDLFHGKELCFLILAGVGVIGATLQLLVLPPKVLYQERVSESTSMRGLLRDPRVLISAGSIVVANLALGILIPSLQLWMIDKWNSSAFQLGIIFLPSSIAYLIGTTFLPRLTIKIGRWLCVLLSLPLISISLTFISFTSTWFLTFLPILVIGISIGFVESAMIPLLGHMAYEKYKKEKDHGMENEDDDESQISSIYAANAYAISDLGLSIAYFSAPFVSGPLVKAIGFRWMTWTFSIGISLFAPLVFFLRKT